MFGLLASLLCGLWEGHEAVEGVQREMNKLKRDIVRVTEAKTMSVMKGETN
jgi:hypothetical protein